MRADGERSGARDLVTLEPTDIRSTTLSRGGAPDGPKSRVIGLLRGVGVRRGLMG